VISSLPRDSGAFEWYGSYALDRGRSIAARSTNVDLTSSTSDSDRSSRLISEFRAALLTRISSSSLRWMAAVSRFWVFWITKTIRNVTIVVPVLMTSCQVSDQPKSGPVAAHKMIARNASANVMERPS